MKDEEGNPYSTKRKLNSTRTGLEVQLCRMQIIVLEISQK